MNRVVVLTGASAGVGRAAARAFARRGDAVALLARGAEGLESAEREVDYLGGKALVIPLDVADHGAVDQAADAVEQVLGAIDVWVNNAMVSVFAPINETSPEDFRRVTEVTYLGYVYGTKAALRHMLPRDRGVVIQVGSALAYRAIPLQAAYCGAKHAIEGFTEALRCELAHDNSNVKVTTVHLPALNTPQFGWVKTTLRRQPQPVPPIFQPEVAADAIVWAADHPRREHWVGWPTTRAIIANRVAPGLLDRFLAMTGYDAQQGDAPIGFERPDNLNDPLPGDAGAHGMFDDVAKSRSLMWELGRDRRWTGVAGGAAVAAAYLMSKRRR